MKLNAGCGTHYADGWINVDVWEDSLTHPDVVVKPGASYPFDDDTFDAVYLGHVLEHIEWPLVPAFLMDMCRVAKPNAPILIVGPDVYRTIRLWAAGQEPWFMVESVLEHADSHFQPNPDHWEGAAHHWNCYEDRVVRLLELGELSALSYSNRIPNNPSGQSWHDAELDITWPVVGKHHWQFAVLTRAP